jgi:Rrf2 family iron-sulfur cluster assembly transcriptional regulator
MKLSTKGRYALIAMAYIARKDFSSKVSVAEMANTLGISQTYLEQLFMKLRKANLVRASRGVRWL